MRQIKQHPSGAQLRRSLNVALLLPFAVAGTSLVCFALDTTESDRGGVRFVFEAAFILGTLTTARACALFTAIDEITDRDDAELPPLPAAEVAIPDEPAPPPSPSRRSPTKGAIRGRALSGAGGGTRRPGPRVYEP